MNIRTIAAMAMALPVSDQPVISELGLDLPLAGSRLDIVCMRSPFVKVRRILGNGASH